MKSRVMIDIPYLRGLYKTMTDITNKDSEQDVKIAVLDSTLENATRRMELIHKRIDRTEERVTKLNEDVRERIRALEKWVWGAGAVLTAFIVIGGVVGDLDLLPDSEVIENAS